MAKTYFDKPGQSERCKGDLVTWHLSRDSYLTRKGERLKQEVNSGRIGKCVRMLPRGGGVFLHRVHSGVTAVACFVCRRSRRCQGNEIIVPVDCDKHRETFWHLLRTVYKMLRDRFLSVLGIQLHGVPFGHLFLCIVCEYIYMLDKFSSHCARDQREKTLFLCFTGTVPKIFKNFSGILSPYFITDKVALC